MTSMRSIRPRHSLPGCSDRGARLTFHQEIQDAVAVRERLVLIVGPKAALSNRS
jgi:hypothetical protein